MQCSLIDKPVEQQVQHLFRSGEWSVCAEKDGDVSRVVPSKGRHHVLNQSLQGSCFNGAHLAGLVQAEGGVRVHAQPALAFGGRVVHLHLPQSDGEYSSILHLLTDLLSGIL